MNECGDDDSEKCDANIRTTNKKKNVGYLKTDTRIILRASMTPRKLVTGYRGPRAKKVSKSKPR